MKMQNKKFDELSNRIIGVAIEVHKKLGPGFLESIYHNGMKKILSYHKIPYETEKEIKIFLMGDEIGTHRIDLIVDNKIVVELKAVEEISKVHVAQLISHLKASGIQIGLILNFSKSKIDIRRHELEKYLQSNIE